MSRRVIPGLESPDPVLESEVRTRLDRVEEAFRLARSGEATKVVVEP